MQSKTVICHDSFNILGGGETLSLFLSDILSADLLYGFIDKKFYPYLKDYDYKFLLNYTFPEILQRIISIRKFQTKDYCKKYKNIIYTGNYSVFNATLNKNSNKIYYCYSPPKFAFPISKDYLKSQKKFNHFISRLFKKFFINEYYKSLNNCNKIISISYECKNRLKKFLDIDSEVIYPPVDSERFLNLGDDDFYLSTSRLEKYKNIDIAIKAFKKLKEKKLIVTNTGSDEKRLKKIAGDSDNIFFTGVVSSKKLRELVGKCSGLIYLSSDEDFGLSVIESMSAKKVIICNNSGSFKELIKNGENGILIELNYLDLIQSIKNLNNSYVDYLSYNSYKSLDKFSKYNFENSINKFLIK